MSGIYLCSRRYREFEMFSSLLKREHPDYNFPPFPSKWPFMTDQQLEVRRRNLEYFLDKSKHFEYFLNLNKALKFDLLFEYLLSK